jgi:maltodextrin utilization protein YvdJ
MPWQHSRFHAFSFNAAVFMKFALTFLTALLLAPLAALYAADTRQRPYATSAMLPRD